MHNVELWGRRLDRVHPCGAWNLADRLSKTVLRREYVFQTWIRQPDAGAIRASAPSARRALRCRRNLALTHALHGISRHRNGRARVRSRHAVRHTVRYLLPDRRADDPRVVPARSPSDRTAHRATRAPLAVGRIAADPDRRVPGCFLGVLAIIAIQPNRAASIAVAASMLILAWIAWRVASSQAVMFGEDPAARIRRRRAPSGQPRDRNGGARVRSRRDPRRLVGHHGSGKLRILR